MPSRIFISCVSETVSGKIKVIFKKISTKYTFYVNGSCDLGHHICVNAKSVSVTLWRYTNTDMHTSKKTTL